MNTNNNKYIILYQRSYGCISTGCTNIHAKFLEKELIDLVEKNTRGRASIVVETFSIYIHLFFIFSPGINVFNTMSCVDLFGR